MRMNKKILLHIIIQLLIFVGLFSISRSLLYNIYLYEWTSKHLYCGTWIIMLILCVRKKVDVAWFITAGNVLGIVIGQLLGDFIKNIRMKKITVETSAEDVYQLSHHYGVFIWILFVFIIFLVGELLHKRKVSKMS